MRTHPQVVGLALRLSLAALVAAQTIAPAPQQAQTALSSKPAAFQPLDPAAPTPSAGASQKVSGDEVPAGLSRGDWNQIRAAVETSSYHASPVEKPGEAPAFVAANREQRYRTTFRRDGIEIASKPAPGNDWRLSVSVTGFGYEGDVRPLPAAEPVAEKGRVEYRRGQVTEWYENRTGGLEQGFTIAEAPAGAAGPLVVALAVNIDLAMTVKNRTAFFADASGKPVLQYSGLRASDADGRDLTSWLQASEGELRLLVEAKDARYPVTVDPTFIQQAKLEGHLDPGVAQTMSWLAVAVSGDTAVLGAAEDYTAYGAEAGSARTFVRSGAVWTEQQVLVPSDGKSYSSFGGSVAISGDTIVVGAPGDPSEDFSGTGSAFVFVRSGTVWTQQQKLLASDAAPQDTFGAAVAVDGDTAVIGAYGAGVAYAFVRSGAAWSEQQKLVASGGRVGSYYFGTFVSVSGNTAVVGAPGMNAGAAYVFVRSGTLWSEQQELTPSDGIAGDAFGSSVSISGDTVVVGASRHDVAGITDAGAAYVFARSGTVWSQQQKLVAFDGGAPRQFGYSVSLSGDTALIGDSVRGTGVGAAAYVFVRSGTVWSEQQKLLASDGAAYNIFGFSVSISGDTAIVGAAVVAASAYAFVRSGVTWNEEQRLLLPDSPLGDFGYSVSVSGDTVLIGVPLDNTAAGNEAGSAYVFTRSGTVWTEQQKLFASDGAANDRFGYSVSVSGDTALVGALDHRTGGLIDAGAAYVFVRSGMVWSQQQKLLAPDAAVYDRFGSSVSVSGDTAVVGAPQKTDDGGETRRGAAYVFMRSGTAWSQHQELTVSDGTAYFGLSVSISGNTAVVGTYGTAHVFTRTGSLWSEQQRLLHPGGTAAGYYAYFGYSVSVSGDTAVVGAMDDTTNAVEAGSAYVFIRSGTVWSVQQKLVAPDGAAYDTFGISVSVFGDTAVVGALLDDVAAGYHAGSAYVFARSGTDWSLHQKLERPNAGPWSLFGTSVSVDGDSVVVGAPGALFLGNWGSAFVFQSALSADLSVTKSDGVANVEPGGSLAYTIAVANAGPDPANDAHVTDSLPAALSCTTTCIGSGGATCTPGPFAGSISDTVSIPAGQSVTYNSSCTVSPAATGTISNTATVTAPSTVVDLNLANNSATDVDAITVATVTTVSSSKTPALPLESVTLTATVAPSATGTVTFKDGAATIGSSALVAGQAALGAAFASAGSHAITAVYGGDASHLPSTSPVLAQVVSRPAADFGGDGRAELPWRHSASGALEWFGYDGATWTRASIGAEPDASWRVAGFGDFDGDVRSDVVWRKASSGDVRVSLTDGATTIVGTIADASWRIEGVGDLDGDGKADLVWRYRETGDVYAWLMDGATVLSQAWVGTVGDAGWQIRAVADLDGDGKSDVLWRHETTGQVYGWIMNGAAIASSGLTTPVPEASNYWQIVAVTDMNGDGKSDVVWRGNAIGNLYVWFMNGLSQASEAEVANWPAPSWDLMQIEDVDGDGKGDVAFHDQATGDVVVWKMDGVTVMGQWNAGNDADLRWDVANRKVLGDGKSDLLWWYAGSGHVYQWLLNGTYSKAETGFNQVPDTSWQIEGVGDVNGDGRDDLVWRHQTLGSVLGWVTDGLSVRARGGLGQIADATWRIAGMGDVDGDGRDDLVWRNDSLDDVYAWQTNGLNATTPVNLGSRDHGWVLVGVADVDADGKDDLVWHQSSTGTLEAWLMNGASHTTWTIGTQSAPWSAAGLADVNGDGRSDVVWRNGATGDVEIWLLASGSHTTGTLSLPDLDWSLKAAGDANGDGKQDLVWRHATTGVVHVWLMNGSATIGEGPLGTPVADTNWKIVGAIR